MPIRPTVTIATPDGKKFVDRLFSHSESVSIIIGLQGVNRV